jgi:hypothetical protein
MVTDANRALSRAHAHQRMVDAPSVNLSGDTAGYHERVDRDKAGLTHLPPRGTRIATHELDASLARRLRRSLQDCSLAVTAS